LPATSASGLSGITYSLEFPVGNGRYYTASSVSNEQQRRSAAFALAVAQDRPHG
jgi:hypothetical protein